MRLIPDWKRSWKFASIQWNLVGILCMFVEVANETWQLLPPQITDKIPNAPHVALVLFTLAMLGRLLKIKEKPNDSKEEHW